MRDINQALAALTGDLTYADRDTPGYRRINITRGAAA